MTFADRLLLEQEYKCWVEDESKRVGAAIDGTRFSTMLAFLKTRRMLITYNPDKKAELVNHLISSGAVTVDYEVERLDSLAALPAWHCSHGAVVTVDYNKLADVAVEWLLKAK